MTALPGTKKMSYCNRIVTHIIERIDRNNVITYVDSEVPAHLPMVFFP